MLHKPVLLEEVLQYLQIKKDGVYIDCTFGLGGHSRSILQKLSEKGKLIAIELDKKQIDLVRQDFFFSLPNFWLFHDNFVNLTNYFFQLNIIEIDGVLLDLGLSSYQLNDLDRGFSFREDAPLVMCFNSDSQLTAEYVINNFSVRQLSDIFYLYGEEHKSRSIARKIVERRKRKKITTTQFLVSIIASCFSRKTIKHPARRVFQALRIYLNKELENLTSVLKTSLECLTIKGRIIVISYHSLEDRIVKNIFKQYSLSGNFCVITKKPLVPSASEIENNHRARSAKMRVIERIN